MFNTINFQKKKEKILIAVALGALAIGGVVIAMILTKEEAPMSFIEVEKPREPQINWEILEGEEISDLQPFPEVPDYQGPVGRENPFLPF